MKPDGDWPEWRIPERRSTTRFLDPVRPRVYHGVRRRKPSRLPKEEVARRERWFRGLSKCGRRFIGKGYVKRHEARCPACLGVA